MKYFYLFILSLSSTLSWSQHSKSPVINFWSLEVSHVFDFGFVQKLKPVNSFYYNQGIEEQNIIALKGIRTFQDQQTKLPALRLSYHRHTRLKLGLNFSLGYQNLPGSYLSQEIHTLLNGYNYQGLDFMKINTSAFNFGLSARLPLSKIPFKTAITLGFEYSLLHSQINRQRTLTNPNKHILIKEKGNYFSAVPSFFIGIGKRFLISNNKALEAGLRFNIVPENRKLFTEADGWFTNENPMSSETPKMNPNALRYHAHYLLKNFLNYEVYFSFTLFNVQYK